MTRFVHVIVAVLVALTTSRAHASPPVRIDASMTHVALTPYLDVFEDTTAKLGIDDVTRPDIAERFTPFHGRNGPNYGFTHSAIWLRCTVENTSDESLERWIAAGVPTIETLEAFRDGEPPAMQGVLHPKANRELPRWGYTFRLALAPHQVRTFYLRGSGYSEVQLPVDLWQLGALMASDSHHQAILLLAYGVLLTMALYNAFLFFFVRDRAHLYYAASIACAAGWLACIDGSLLDLMPASVQTIPHAINIVTLTGYVVFATAFLRRFLELSSAHPRLSRWVMRWVGIVVLTGPIPYLLGLIDYRVNNIIMPVTAVVTMGMWIVIAVLRMREGVGSARYFLVGWVLFALVVVVSLLSTQGAIPTTIGFLPPHMGFGIEAVFFSLALADATRRRNDSIAALHQEAEGRVKELETRQREVTQLNDELRHQVAERSRELGEALSTVDAAATSPVEVGERFHGRYRVLRVLGEGGMGVVYEVERVTDAQRFALKVISGAQSGVNAARFLREAEIGARVRHPNVVSIVDVGVERGAPFLVMELVTGQPLEEMRARFGDVAWAMPILGQVLEGLAALHDAGVVHRDLKPGNILVGGAAKISDFGISRLGAPTTSAVNVEGATVDASASRKDLTGTGAFLGTPNYMAPETARGGRDVGVASDMFAFGIIAYELLTSRSPFAMPPVVLAMAGQPIPPPSPLDATVPERLSALVLACLSIDPSARPSARDAARVTG